MPLGGEHALACQGFCGLPPEKSRDTLAKAVELAEEAGLLEVAAWARNSLGVHHIYMLADARAARDHCRRSAELYRQVGRTVDEIYVLASVSMDSQFLGEFEEAEAALSLMRQLLSQLGEPGRGAENACFCEIWFLGHRGEWLEAGRRHAKEKAPGGPSRVQRTPATPEAGRRVA